MSGLKKLMKPSEALAKITGPDPLPRTQVMKKIWEYIKANKLQSPKDGRKILPDETLKPIFENNEEINMMQIAKFISAHLSKVE